jgi:hypothetical protein
MRGTVRFRRCAFLMSTVSRTIFHTALRSLKERTYLKGLSHEMVFAVEDMHGQLKA